MTEKSAKPQLRFAGFDDTWEQRKAKDLCSISTGKSNTQDLVDDGIYPFYVRSPIVEHSNRYLFDEEAVLTVGDGVGTGKVFHYVNGKYDLHQRVYRMFDFSEEITAKYFYYYFSNHFYDRVMAMTAKTSVDSVRYEMIADMDIALPKVQEQMAISDYFNRLDNLITLHQRKYDKLTNVKKSMLEKMFPKNGSNVPEIRFKGFSDAWEQRKLGELLQTLPFKQFLKEPEPDGKYEIIQQGNEPVIGFANGTPCNDYIDTVIFGDHTLSLYKPKRPFFVATDGVRIVKGKKNTDGYYLLSLLERYKPQSEGYKRYYSILADVECFTTYSASEQKQLGTYFENLDNLITLHQRECIYLFS